MRALVRFLLSSWFIISSALGLLFGLTPLETLRTQQQQANAGVFGPPALPAVRAARYQGLRVGLLATAVLSAGGLGLLRRAGRRLAAARWRTEWRGGRRSLVAAWQRLRPVQRWVALLLGAAALGLRSWLLLRSPITIDELTSYDFFVRPGLATTVSSYTVPNNHVLHNLLVGGLAELTGLAPDVVQRLPALLVSAALLPLSYLLLLRYLRFGAATLALGWFTFLPLPVFYAVAGRGYSLQLAAAIVGLFAALELLRPGGRRWLPEAAFVLSGSLGLYAVPSHAGLLAAFGLVLAAAYARLAPRVRWLRLGRLAVATGGIALTAGLLYAPVGAISGWEALFQNPYVRSSLSWAAFGDGLPAYLLETASQLWGHGRWTVPGLAGLLVLGPVALARLRPRLRPLGWLSLAGMVVPLAFSSMQRLYSPPRTLLASVFCSGVLLALLVQEGLGWWQRRQPGWAHPRTRQAVAVGALVAVYGAGRLRAESGLLQSLRQHHQAIAQQYRWLRAQRPQRVWLSEASYVGHGIYWYHQGLVAGAPLPLVVATALPRPAAGQRAREYVIFNQPLAAPPPAMLQGRAPVYADAYICIWRLDAPLAAVGK
jgi:hypothetical protein